MGIHLASEIFNVREYDIGGLVFKLGVLTPPRRGYVASQTSIDDDIFLTGIPINWNPANDLKAMSCVDLFGDSSQG